MPTGQHSFQQQLAVSTQSTIPTTSLVDIQLPSECTDSKESSAASPRTYDAERNGNGAGQFANAQHKLEALKTWGISAYKCTKQAIAERLGKSSRTVDADMEGKMSLLRELQQRYNRLLLLTKALIGHLRHVQYTQIQLAEQLSQLAVREKDLQSDFMQNAQVLKCTSENCEHLLAALHFFTSSMNTLCNTTIEDTMVTVRQFESARLEYDAYRTELDTLKRSATRPPDFIVKLTEAENACAKHQGKYEQLRSDVEAKLSLLSANKVRVLKKQMQLFNNALVAYYSGNQKALEAVLKQFSVRSAQNSRLKVEEP
uniref:AH domain-containing protein n=1 Tax=Trichuris muris TaxID=70415 RepID=A0A5S6QMD4_TRIMR